MQISCSGLLRPDLQADDPAALELAAADLLHPDGDRRHFLPPHHLLLHPRLARHQQERQGDQGEGHDQVTIMKAFSHKVNFEEKEFPLDFFQPARAPEAAAERREEVAAPHPGHHRGLRRLRRARLHLLHALAHGGHLASSHPTHW